MASLSSTRGFSLRFSLLLPFLSLLLLFLHIAHAADILAVPPTGACGRPTPGGQRPGTHQEATINNRSYLIFLPSNYGDGHSGLFRPLILSFHGGGMTPIQQLNLDNFTSPDFNQNAVVVYPEGENVSTVALLILISL
jgi:poly(3-hydroxybutyrate) depolymerase